MFLMKQANYFDRKIIKNQFKMSVIDFKTYVRA